ncbi:MULTISPECIES: PepSY domain-containing protein [Methylorubrum]|uniref:PepSY domain-containing protein n=1 Tax=Methylorubrum TaxID=2282523 RepID=UPI00209EA03E|nr:MULTISPECIES: PepSY domain-containing protein [Methylorubrum]MCP1550257.1 putative membrane protein [Methylorubrum zatmanii]MCP1553129.1 putative membrane protein [Methylorubrum extorquens]MCP1580560.1 putative membrane protein [Methylorubrum extorquens]
MRTLLKRGKRWLYLAHRWLGIATCLLFVTWFLSGLVMMYVGFPSLTDTDRQGGLPRITWDRVAVTPREALEAAGQTRFPRDLRLTMLDHEPVYRIVGWDGGQETVSAVEPRPITGVDAGQALAIARHDRRARQPRLLGEVDRDQWSVTARYDPLRPFHLVALGDTDETHLYVSARTGQIALDTTGQERFWNWFGAIPHWIYVTPLRAQAALWRDVVLWVSGVAIVGAVTGLWVGLLRARLRRRYASGSVSPYRGWAAWHHLAGLIGGLTVLTFIASGWLSMNPNRWFGSRAPSQAMLERYASVTAPLWDLELAAVRAAACPNAVEARFGWLGGEPQAVVSCQDGSTLTCCAPATLPASPAISRLASAARQLLPDVPIRDAVLLTKEDAYWYSHHHQRRLPVLRVKFADSDETWFHIDPTTGEVLNRADRSSRTYRWLFNALHSFDFRFLLQRRPAWDAVLWLLSAAGLIISVSGVVIGWRRLIHRIAE